MDVLLAVKDAADLMNVEYDVVKKRIQRGQMVCIEKEDELGRGGKAGVAYLVPLASLEEKYQTRYYARERRKKAADRRMIEAEPAKEIDEFTAKERRQIEHRKMVLAEWDQYRSRPGVSSLTVADQNWLDLWNRSHPEEQLSYSTLKRWKRNYKRQGDEGLVEKRGKVLKGRSSIDPWAWSVFQQYYLTQQRMDATFCYKMTEELAKIERPDLLPLPSYRTFFRHIDSIPYAVVRLERFGDKAMEDEAMPYIERSYDDLMPNDIWVADNHTLDVITKYHDMTSKTHRLYVTAYQDIRTRKMVGVYITHTPDSDANLYCLKKAIERYGIPRSIYTDNGREFLVHDIGGRGRRKTADLKGEHQVPTILERLGIDFKNAIVRNGRAKICERAFKQFKNEFSKLNNTYCGGHVLERPENLKDKLKNIKSIISDKDFTENFYLYVEGWYNEQPQYGRGMNGKSPNQVFAELLEQTTVRKAAEGDLNLMMMRSTRMQTISRMGVKIKFYGEDFYYWNEELVMNHQGEKAYVRYNPEDVGTVRVYDEHDRFICEAENQTALKYNASKEDIKEMQSKTRRIKKTAKEYKKNNVLNIYDAPDAMDVMLGAAKRNKDGQSDPEAKVVEIVRAEEHEHAIASGHDVEINLGRMVTNLKQFKDKDTF